MSQKKKKNPCSIVEIVLEADEVIAQILNDQTRTLK